MSKSNPRNNKPNKDNYNETKQNKIKQNEIKYNEMKQNEIEKDNVGANKNYKNIKKDEYEEDVTKYGEFVTSYFAWLPPEKQKERAKEIDNMTK